MIREVLPLHVYILQQITKIITSNGGIVKDLWMCRGN